MHLSPYQFTGSQNKLCRTKEYLKSLVNMYQVLGALQTILFL